MAKTTTILEKLGAAFSAQAKAAAELRADLDQLSDKIVTVSNRLADVRAAPVDRTEIEERVDRFLLEAETDARSFFSPGMISSANGSVAGSGIASIVGSSTTHTAMGALIVLGFRDQIRDRLVAEALHATSGRAMSEPEREAEVARLSGELSKLERIREKISREAEKHGLAVHRSEYADPAALLAPDSEL
ncbi:hypothetical protein G6M78_08265 [Agrobacterium tumefaciens]|uniref:hypothetical protein n=1 Tax=Agrobacterium tumefaciens TaxID=358 RepID=UPI001571BC07|nr:hypothetical protein [Agrobacterium tumefaciens]NTE55073.1 hypothetical protein [Agrobacterium tumefaciens]NTE73841.1 hypothetical protein [Agrobacterium tumefaciens]